MTELHAPDGEQLLRPGEVATLLKISERSLRRHAARGEINHEVTLGGHRRYSRTEVERLRALLRRPAVAVA